MSAHSPSVKQLCFRPWLYLLLSLLKFLGHLTIWVGNQCVDTDEEQPSDKAPLAKLVLPQPAMDLLCSPNAPFLTPALIEVLTVISHHYVDAIVRKNVLEEAMQLLVEDHYPNRNDQERFAILDNYANQASLSLRKQALEGLLELGTAEGA